MTSKPALYWSKAQARRTDGYRSGLEARAAQQLEQSQVPYEYEKHKLVYTVPSRDASYTYDFLLNGSMIIETKGIFDVEDRKKMVLIKEQYPELDIRLVFSDAYKKLYKGSPTTYAKWCIDHGFLWAHKTIPSDWLEEAMNSIATDLRMTPAARKILSHLEKYSTISPAEAQATYGATRLAARIHELRENGYEITSDYRKDAAGKRYVRYFMNKKAH